MPRKSRMRGSAAAVRRSRNSYITSRRSVTWQPMGMPSRSLKFETLLRARFTTGLRPVMVFMSFIASSSADFSSVASSPMCTIIFSMRGT